MREPFRIPLHPPVAPHPGATAEPEPQFFDRPCYEFNRGLAAGLNDKYCTHCRHYLTARCPHIDEFLEDVEDLSPE